MILLNFSYKNSKMKVIASIFTDPNKEGDFAWMIQQPQYSNALFLYNDNVEHRLKFIRGGGNAVIRPYNQFNPNVKIPQSAGIPTGSLQNGGFKVLDPSTKKYIDDAIDNIKNLIRIHQYKQVYYSAAPDGTLGSGIFLIHPTVKIYITNQIRSLETES
jgi:hypothetical protein